MKEEIDDRFYVIVNNIQDGIVVINDIGIIEFVNPFLENLFGYSTSELLGQDLKILMMESSLDVYDNYIDSLKQSEKDKHLSVERRLVEMRHKNGRAFSVGLSINQALNKGNNIAIAIINDAREDEFEKKQFLHLSYHDNLTGLVNRPRFFDVLRDSISRAVSSGKAVAIVNLGLDRFKMVNESLGHVAGDMLLMEVARRFQQAMRDGDTLARIGADEFSILLEGIEDADQAMAIVRKMQDALIKSFDILGDEVNITVSAGISIFPEDGANAELLLKNSDVALSQSKDLGGSRIQFYSPEMNEKSYKKLSFENDLRHAFENKEFALFYQPKVDINTGRVQGIEALIRWKHPDTGVILPENFIPTLEETGLIIPVGEWIIAEAGRQIRLWQEAGFKDLVVDVNLSALQFVQKDLPDVINKVLLDNSIEAKSLGFEITEGALLHNIEEAIAILNRMKEMGNILSIDDFGTGYSSLAYLKNLPIDIIKIDQSFVRDVTTDPDSAAIVRSIISLAQNMKLDVVAEGVETEAQLGFMAKNHCDVIQGYYFSKPLSADDMTQLLREGALFDLSVIEDKNKKRTLLLLDDEKHIASALKRVFYKQGYEILAALNADEAFDFMATYDVGVIISDQRMPEMTGTDFFSRVKDLYPDSVRIILSGYTELKSVTDAINEGAIYKFFTKPWDDDLLRKNIREAFKYYEFLTDKENSL